MDSLSESCDTQIQIFVLLFRFGPSYSCIFSCARLKKFSHEWDANTLSGETFVGRNYSSGEIFVTKRKIRHFRPTKSFAQ